MCPPKPPKIPEAPKAAKALEAPAETATFFKRDNGSKELTGDAAKARRSLSDLQVDMTPAGLQVP